MGLLKERQGIQLPEIQFIKLFINGQFVDALSGRTFETIDPSSGEVIAHVAEGDKDDVDLAVKAAREAFDHGRWPRLSGYARGRILSKLADLLEENKEVIGALDALDGGKLYGGVVHREVPGVAQLIRYYAGAADKIHGSTLKASGNFHGYTLLEPVGVVGVVIPWNFPTTMFYLKAAPALAAGCTIVVKPAEQTPLSALFHAHLAKKAGIPDGVVNVVTGFGPTAGAAIASHMDVDAVSFTGSTQIGRQVMTAAATSNLKIVSLELGGKSPLLIFDDADVDVAVPLARFAAFFNKGEVCVSSSRVYVQEGIYDAFVKKLVESSNNWAVGDPFDPHVHQGPQVSKAQYDRVLEYIDIGKNEGATLLSGGKPFGERGYYIEPTVFTDVTEEMTIAQEEIFGPVMSLIKFKTVEDAIEKANATKYGLAAGIVTNDLNTANRVSRSVKAGTVWINTYMVFEPDAPFGGYKLSGFGKDQGLQALHKYLHEKTVITPLHDSPWL